MWIAVYILALAVSTVLENFHFTLVSITGVALVLVGNLLALSGRLKAAPV